MKYAAAIIILVLVSFGSGYYISSMGQTTFATEEIISDAADETVPSGFVPVNVSIDGASVTLANNCRAISFDVTEDQAFAISKGIERSFSIRPLAHDIFIDVLQNFGIGVSQLRIDRFEDDVYKARMQLRQGDKILDIDMRPSDAIALATRLGRTLYVDAGIMNSKSEKVC